MAWTDTVAEQVIVKVELTDLINGLVDVGCERQELRVTECPEPLPRMVFPYIEILGRLGKEQIFFFRVNRGKFRIQFCPC